MSVSPSAEASPAPGVSPAKDRPRTGPWSDGTPPGNPVDLAGRGLPRMTTPGRSTPAWRQVFDTLERAIGRPLEEVATSHAFVDLAVTGLKARRAVTGTAGWIVGGAVNRVLRTANIATRDDLKRLTGQVALLASEVRAGSASAAPASRAVSAPRPTAASATSRAPRRATASVPAKPKAPARSGATATSTSARAARSRPGPARPPSGASAPAEGTTFGGDGDG